MFVRSESPKILNIYKDYAIDFPAQINISDDQFDISIFYLKI